MCSKYGEFGTSDDPSPAMNSLAPCFAELVRNENCSYHRCDLSLDNDLSKLVNESKLAYHAKEGLFLKSLGKSALNRTAAKDLWSVEFESAWIDFKVGLN